MFAVIGILIVLGAVVGGYLMEHGQLLVLLQPAELVIIGGAAIGSLMIANDIRVLKGIIGGLLGAMKGSPINKNSYLELLKMLHDLFASARKNGAAKLEADIENPAESQILSAFPSFLKNHHAVKYLCDTLRLVLMGGVGVHELDALMELDAETHGQEAHEPVGALQTSADSLPGLGIVAAVLGVVITMGALGGPPEEIGHKVAAALVGTFLGILMCYGFIGPLATRMARAHEAEDQYLTCIRQAVVAYVRGCGPMLSAEFARRAVPPHMRPSFQDFEALCKGAPAEGEAAPLKAA
ncbi:MAG TPA: flagellar motor stator protein MotA [Bryobacteraceae bacterium]|nr:flagellar motor stator protein MotA [Bryobacteraceae bacterium]